MAAPQQQTKTDPTPAAPPAGSTVPAPTPGASGTPAAPGAATGSQQQQQQQPSSSSSTTPQPPQPKGTKSDQAPQSAEDVIALEASEVAELAKLGLPDEAQGAVAKIATGVAQRYATAQREEWERTLDEWKTTLEKDPELGGRKAQETVRAVDRALQLYGQGARQVLSDSMLLAHPEVVRMLARIGAVVKEDDLSGSGGPTGKPKSNKAFLDKLYEPKTKKTAG